MNNDQTRTTGYCAVCGTVHVNDDGFDDNRTCRNCGEEQVYSIVEYRDIALDWQKLKEDNLEMAKFLSGDYE